MVAIRPLAFDGTKFKEVPDTDGLRVGAIGVGIAPPASGITCNGTFILGNGDTSGSPATGTLRGTNGLGTNIAGGAVNIDGGQGTGTGAGGSVKIRTAPAGTSGSSLNALQDVVEFKSDRSIEFFGRRIVMPDDTTEGWGIGFNVGTLGAKALALGDNTVASGANSLAVGPSASASAANATAVGTSSVASASGASAFGQGSEATGTESLAMGVGADAVANGTAIGNNAHALGTGGTAFGTGATANADAVACGSSAVAAQSGVALGSSSNAATNGIAIGDSATNNGHASSIALGSSAANTAPNQMVVGGGSTSTFEITDLFLGRTVTGTAPPTTVTFRATSAAGTDVDGSSLVLEAGASTGNANQSFIRLSTPNPGASGGTLQSQIDRVIIHQDYRVTFGRAELNSNPIGFTIDATGGSGTNIAGADLTFAAGRSTGNAAGGSLIFRVSPAGGSGTTLNSLSTALTLFSTLRALFAGEVEIDGDLNHDGSNVGFFGATPVTKPTITGSRGGNAALASLLTAGANLGLWTDNTTA